MWSARGRAQADAQGRSDGVGSEESARPLHCALCRRRGFSLPAFLGETPERRPWARKRERRPGCLCPAFLIVFRYCWSHRVRSIRAAFQTGSEGRLSRLLMETRAASLGRDGLCRRTGLGLAAGVAFTALGCGGHAATGK